MNDIQGIKAANLAASAQTNSLLLLEELQKCVDALGPDSPRAISAQALLDKVYQPLRNTTRSTYEPVSLTPEEYRASQAPRGVAERYKEFAEFNTTGVNNHAV